MKLINLSKNEQALKMAVEINEIEKGKSFITDILKSITERENLVTQLLDQDSVIFESNNVIFKQKCVELIRDLRNITLEVIENISS